MKREIKFRGKPTGMGGIWMVGIGAYKTHTAEHLVLNAKCDCVEVVHLCQYTGLKDCNGKEIYEGDIIKTPRGNIGMVIFGKAEETVTHYVYLRKFTYVYATYGWVFKLINDGYKCAIIDNSILDGNCIGNIYDNPELMKE